MTPHPVFTVPQRSARVGLAVLALAIVMGTSSGTRAQTPKLEGYPPVGEPPTLAVSSTGAEPRARLRYSIPPAYRGRMLMTMGMSMAMNMNGAAMPPVTIPPFRMTADLAVTDVAASGDISYTFAFVGIDTDDANVRATMEPVLAALSQIKGAVVVSNRGVTKSATFDVSKIPDPQARQAMSSAFESLRYISLPLPEEPVGVGARWTVRQSVESNGIYSGQKVDVELAAFDQKSASLKVVMEQTGPPQKVTLPELPSANVMLQKLQGSGAGTTQLALDALIPTSDVNTLTNTLMDIDVGGSRQSMGVDVTLKVTVAPASGGSDGGNR